jgi:ketol-acid reductoisomerase
MVRRVLPLHRSLSGYLTHRIELTVLERDDWPRQRLHEYFKNDTLAIIGYGSQGHGQGLNLRDNGLNVIVGVRKNGASWKEALDDGWKAGQNLFDIDEAISRGTIIMNLLSDAAQSETWPAIKPQLTKGKVGMARTCNNKD